MGRTCCIPRKEGTCIQGAGTSARERYKRKNNIKMNIRQIVWVIRAGFIRLRTGTIDSSLQIR
jgi:hypothetical protein